MAPVEGSRRAAGRENVANNTAAMLDAEEAYRIECMPLNN